MYAFRSENNETTAEARPDTKGIKIELKIIFYFSFRTYFSLYKDKIDCQKYYCKANHVFE